MEKKVWVQPLATIEQFVANEYVAACWSVTCDRPEATDAPASNGGVFDEINTNNINITHRKEFCGVQNHYQIGLDNNGTPVDMIETQTDNLGDLPCTLYTDATYKTTKAVSTVKSGDYIYWTTSSGGRTWHHHGPVSGTSNHS